MTLSPGSASCKDLFVLERRPFSPPLNAAGPGHTLGSLDRASGMTCPDSGTGCLHWLAVRPLCNRFFHVHAVLSEKKDGSPFAVKSISEQQT